MRNRRPIGLALLVLVQGPAFALMRFLLEILPLPARIRARWQWSLRKGFWNNLGRLKFRGSRPIKIPVPAGSLKKIDRVSFRVIFPSIPIDNIKVADQVPAEERDFAMTFFTWFQVLMYRLLSPMQPGLPPIDSDPYEALGQVYTKRHRKLFDSPVMPLEFQGSPDLGALAVKGPYAYYLKKCGEEEYEWDFTDLKQYQHLPELYNLGVRVLFRVDKDTGTVKPVQIESELGLSKPGDATWEFAKKLALSAATNHLSLVRHFNGVHLASSAHLAIATRNCLFPDHPLSRLLWPYIFRTQQSNRAVTRAQMVKGGDFDSIFSFTHKGMRDLFSATYGHYDFIVNDPEEDAKRRGIIKGGFDTPTQDDLQKLFDLLHRHAEQYVNIYYKTNSDIRNEKGQPVLRWLDELNDPQNGIPNGLPVMSANVTIAGLSRLVACFMYLVTVQHDIVGSFLWNYQLWVNKQPTRIYRNGKRMPLDVYQRLVNANFNLNVPRTPLINDFSDLALADANRNQTIAVLKDFQADLADLEAKWRMEPWHVWRVYPKLLEVNINA